MSFQLKDFVSIVAAAVNHAKATQDQLTDFEIGSVARTIIEAPSIEIEELYQRIFAGILDAIPTSIYKAFDFELIGEASASGNLTLSFTPAVSVAFTIPAGTVFDDPVSGLKFVSTGDVAVPPGATSAIVVIVCQTAGTSGNVGAGVITRVINYTLPTGTVIGNQAITSGRDQQTELERKARFAEFILSLSRGTEGAIRYAVRQAKILNGAGQLLEYVSRVGIVEFGGLVDVYIYGSGGIASQALIDAAQQIIDGRRNPATGAYEPGYRAIGVSVTARAMAERAVPVTFQVMPSYGVSPSPALKDNIETLLASEFEVVNSGEVLLIDQLIGAALTVAGIQKVVSSNNANIPCAANEVLKLGAFTVEWLPNA